MDEKQAIKSKTIQTNSAVVLTAVLVLVNNGFNLAAPESSAAIGAIVLAVVNMALRFITKSPIRFG